MSYLRTKFQQNPSNFFDHSLSQAVITTRFARGAQVWGVVVSCTNYARCTNYVRYTNYVMCTNYVSCKVYKLRHVYELRQLYKLRKSTNLRSWFRSFAAPLLLTFYTHKSFVPGKSPNILIFIYHELPSYKVSAKSKQLFWEGGR